MDNPFESIQDISQRRLAFLEDEIEHYNLNNRSQPEQSCSPSACTYYPAHSQTEGCAIGRWLERDNPIITNKMNGTVTNSSIFSRLPKWMQEMGGDFLEVVQLLHDRSSNWDEKGLSFSGREAKDKIISLGYLTNKA